MKHKRKRQKKVYKKNKKYWELENSLRFTTGNKDTFWKPGQADNGNYVQPVTDCITMDYDLNRHKMYLTTRR